MELKNAASWFSLWYKIIPSGTSSASNGSQIPLSPTCYWFCKSHELGLFPLFACQKIQLTCAIRSSMSLHDYMLFFCTVCTVGSRWCLCRKWLETSETRPFQISLCLPGFVPFISGRHERISKHASSRRKLGVRRNRFLHS